MVTKFPLTLKAMQKGEKVQWAIGDALIKECGPPGDDGVKTGTNKKLEQVGEEAARNGFEYDLNTLQTLRRVSHVFNAMTRITASWSIHKIAGNPETLQAIIKKAKGKKLTAQLARDIKYELTHANDDDEEERGRDRPNPRPRPPLPDDLDDEDDTPPDGVGLSRESTTLSSCTRYLEYATDVLQTKGVELDEEIFDEFSEKLAKLNQAMQKFPRTKLRVIKGGKN